jgi:type II secretory ATPase GspE/PulE/Tfp pilus assembly ATPase PilB-like protein
MQYAAVRGASDVHLVPSGDGCVVKLRVDGELLQHREHLYDTIFHDQIVNRLKVLASLDISTRLLPQDGAFVFPVAGGDRHIRISILPSIYGESVVLRFARESAVPLLSELGVEPMTLAVLREALSEGGGLFAFTGPTGSGKTTTMYSLAAELDRRGRNVVTVEDPVEKRLLGPVQIQVRTAQGFTFAKAIRSVLRHDPDVVLIGEMRDAESAQIGLEAASTGHLTLTSLHIASALQAVSRLETIGIPRRQGVEALSLVLNQRLLPKLCVKCRRRVEGIVQQRATAGSFESVGCRACSGSGYSGLVLITELLDLRSERAKEAMMEQAMPLALAERLSSAAYMSWEVALQYHLSRGHITKAQAEEFLRGDG